MPSQPDEIDQMVEEQIRVARQIEEASKIFFKENPNENICQIEILNPKTGIKRAITITRKK